LVVTSIQHRIHGAFDGFQLFDGCVRKNESPSFAVDSTTAAPIVASNEQESISNGGYGGDSDSTNNNAIPTMTTGGDSEEEYEDEDEDMNDSEDESSDEYTTSDVNSINAQQSISFSGSSDADATTIRGLWIAHGILLSIAWGILAPLAIGAPFLRNNFNVLKTNGRWLQIHFYLSGLVALFTLLGFILAVVATKKQDGSALNFNEDVHHKSGLAIFILVIIQAFAGYFRPSPPPPPPTSSLADNKVVTNKSSSVRDIPDNSNTFDEEVVYNSSGDSEALETTKQSTSSSSGTTSSSKKSYLRLFWECGHRLLGIVLLVLAVYNCHTGIILQSDNYYQDDKETLTNIFWSITGSITGIIFFLRFVVRL
jgi:hypothetical protein